MKLLNRDLSKYTLRKEQEDAEKHVFDTMESDPSKKFFLLDMPPGVGKSVLTLSMIKRYFKDIEPDANVDVLTESKSLQKQYSDEFNSISNLWGKNGYNCEQFNCSCEQGKDFGAAAASKCESCPYDSARIGFMEGRISLTNFYMFILLQMSGVLKQRESNILIVDEAHELESVYSNFLSIDMTEKSLKNYGVPDFVNIMKNMKKIKEVSEFKEYCEDFLLIKLGTRLGVMTSEISRLEKQALNRQVNIDKVLGNTSNGFIEMGKDKEKLKSFMSRIEYFITEFDNSPNNWVLQQSYDDNKNLKINIQPVWSNKYINEHIWSHYDTVILMSGTILSKSMFCYINGIPENLASYYMIDSPFDVKKRPIYYMPVGRMSYKDKEKAFVTYPPMLKKLLKKYSNKKGIIHTVTFELQRWISEILDTERLLLHTSDQDSKNFALKHHYTVKKPTILVSPSMYTGIDLKNGRARFQICLKVPYPYLGDIKNKKRMETNPEWYSWATVSKLIQMYGRGVRNLDDYADFIILDGCFSDVLNRSAHLLPEWVLNAIKKVDVR